MRFCSEEATPRYWLFCSTLLSRLSAVGAAPTDRVRPERGRGTGMTGGGKGGRGSGKVGGRKGLMKMLMGAAGAAVVVVPVVVETVELVVEEEAVTNFTGSRS